MTKRCPEQRRQSLEDEIFAGASPVTRRERIKDGVNSITAAVTAAAILLGSLAAGGEIIREELHRDWELFKTTINDNNAYR